MSSFTTSQSDNIKVVNESKILKAAKKLFLKKGYFNVNIAKIAREAGVSKATIYTYFQGKDDILRHLIEIHFNTTPRFGHSLKGIAAIKDFIDRSINSLEHHCSFLRVIYPMVFFTDSQKDLKDFLYEITMKQIKELTPAFEAIGSEHPFGDAALLVTEIDGMYLHYMSVKDKYQLQVFKDILYHRYKLD